MPPAPALPPGPWIGSPSATNTAWAGPWGVSFTANLTPDKETGLGDWTEEQFIATMQHRASTRARAAPCCRRCRSSVGAERSRHQGAVGVPAVAAAGEEPGAAADRPAGRSTAVTTRQARALMAAGALLWLEPRPAACWAPARRASDVAATAPALLSRDRALRRRRDADDRRAQPPVLAAVSAVERRRRQAPVGAAAGRRRHRRRRRSIDWDFPVGTRFWKEFAFKGRKVETRFLWKTARGSVDVRVVSPGTRRRPTRRWRRRRASPTSPKWRPASGTASRRTTSAARATTRAAPRCSASTRCSSRPTAIRWRRTPSHSTTGMVTLRTLVDEQRCTPARPELRDRAAAHRRRRRPRARPRSATSRPTAAAATTGRARSRRWGCS